MMKNIGIKLKYIALGLVGTVTLLAIWSFIEPRVLNTETETAQIPNLPKSWSGKKIAQISDFQIGLWGDNRGTAHRSVAKIIEANPAIALISGDFLYHPGKNIKPEIETAVNIVRPLVEAGIPTYAVLGNHDYGMSSKKAEPKTKRHQIPASRLTRKYQQAGEQSVSRNTGLPEWQQSVRSGGEQNGAATVSLLRTPRNHRSSRVPHIVTRHLTHSITTQRGIP